MIKQLKDHVRFLAPQLFHPHTKKKGSSVLDFFLNPTVSFTLICYIKEIRTHSLCIKRLACNQIH